jgi:hypothetical protein
VSGSTSGTETKRPSRTDRQALFICVTRSSNLGREVCRCRMRRHDTRHGTRQRRTMMNRFHRGWFRWVRLSLDLSSFPFVLCPVLWAIPRQGPIELECDCSRKSTEEHDRISDVHERRQQKARKWYIYRAYDTGTKETLNNKPVSPSRPAQRTMGRRENPRPVLGTKITLGIQIRPMQSGGLCPCGAWSGLSSRRASYAPSGG